MGTLRALIPPTAVVVDDVRLSLDHVAASRGEYRLVNRRGEMLQGGVHVARRREVGVETLLRARNELQAVAGERAGAIETREEARSAAVAADEGLKRVEVAVREAQEALQQAERTLAGQKNDGELCGRRLEEARRQSVELRAREEREGGLAGKMAEQLAEAEKKISEQEAELEAARAEVRAMQGRLEKLRENVTIVEQKKAQAGLVEVRLRERCRAREGERERVTGQLRAAVAGVEQWERRTGISGEVPAALERHADGGGAPGRAQPGGEDRLRGPSGGSARGGRGRRAAHARHRRLGDGPCAAI